MKTVRNQSLSRSLIKESQYFSGPILSATISDTFRSDILQQRLISDFICVFTRYVINVDSFMASFPFKTFLRFSVVLVSHLKLVICQALAAITNRKILKPFVICDCCALQDGVNSGNELILNKLIKYDSQGNKLDSTSSLGENVLLCSCNMI